jgi:ribonuclease HI
LIQKDLIIYSDGASRGNPGLAAIGASLQDNANVEIANISETIGIATNNVAEYQALHEALKAAERLGYKRITVKADSELMIKQLQGLYKVKNKELLKIYLEIKLLEKGFDSVNYNHIPREQNKRADALANKALDAQY